MKKLLQAFSLFMILVISIIGCKKDDTPGRFGAEVELATRSADAVLVIKRYTASGQEIDSRSIHRKNGVFFLDYSLFDAALVVVGSEDGQFAEAIVVASYIAERSTNSNRRLAAVNISLSVRNTVYFIDRNNPVVRFRL